MGSPLSLSYRERDFESLIKGLRAQSSSDQATILVFAGGTPEATQKAAQLLARDLGAQLMVMHLQTLASRFIGETEKNLDALFQRAQAAEAVLFFAEADALFGTRTDVRDAEDRYANLDSAELLRRIERYQGIVILASNTAQNLKDRLRARLIHVQFDA
jgi:SpoVK/Ycf46/Vps4 family AAA+-type ATPase